MSIIQSGFSHSYLCTSRPWTTKLQMFPSRFPLWKICKAIPKSSQRRGKEKQCPWQNPGDWILEQRGKRIQSMTCSVKQLFYLCICKRRWRPWEHTARRPGLSRRPTSPGPGPEASMKKWWDYVMTHKQKKSLSHPFNVQPSARRLRYILVSETLVLLKAFDTSKTMLWPQNFCLLFFFSKGPVRVTADILRKLCLHRRAARWGSLVAATGSVTLTPTHSEHCLGSAAPYVYFFVTWKHNFVEKYELL